MRKGKKRLLTTPQQIKGVANLLSGKYASPGAALTAAGYNNQHFDKFIKQDGVKRFLKYLDIESERMYGMPIASKVMKTFSEALEATKLYGKDAMEHPDYAVRVNVASKLAEMLGVKETPNTTQQVTTNTQYNFFSVPQDKQEKFNKGFLEFVSGYKEPAAPDSPGSQTIKETTVK